MPATKLIIKIGDYLIVCKTKKTSNTNIYEYDLIPFNASDTLKVKVYKSYLYLNFLIIRLLLF